MNQPVMKAASLSRAKIEFIGQKILKDFCPAALSEMIPLDIERMFEIYIPKRFGITTGYEELSMGIHGYTDPNKMTSAIAVNLIDTGTALTKFRSDRRIRFTLRKPSNFYYRRLF